MINKLALRLKNEFPEFYQRILNFKQGRYNYTFFKDKYPNSFLTKDAEGPFSSIEAPEIIYCFWTGNNPLTENRKKALEKMQKNVDIPVKLITPENLSEYIKPNFPLHKAYEFLSLTMRSDYLRCYFMHHHGGGYADIKPFNNSWKTAFKQLNNDNSKYAIGYPELLHGGLAPVEHRFILHKNYDNYDNLLYTENKIHSDLTKHTPLLIGNCGFICKPNTPITNEWMNEVNHRMDELYNYLTQTNTKGTDLIPYFYLVQIFHPIILKYHKNIIQYKNLLPILKDYR